jgi:hypothetical protein
MMIYIYIYIMEGARCSTLH